MANIAALRQNVVVCIAPSVQTIPASVAYDASRDATGANVGDTWNGSAYVRPPVPQEQTNAAILADQADAALITNLQTIADIDAWLAGTGAGTTTLTTAQLSPAVRQLMREAKASAQQRNGIIRQLRGRLDAIT